MECIPCNKKFNGQAPYKDHMVSEKHKRKAASYAVLSQTGATTGLNSQKTAVDLYKSSYCDICGISCISLEEYIIHLRTLEHAEKVLSEGKNCNINSSVISSSSIKMNVDEFADEEMNGIKNENKSDMIMYEFQKQNNIKTPEFSTCFLCNKSFSGPEPYRQHQESTAHLRKVEMQKSEYQSLTFSCETCDKRFTGKVPYDQHMNSDIHKKKLQNLETFKNLKSIVEESSEIEKNVLKVDPCNFFCSICQVNCCGWNNYQQHLKGSRHMKKAKQQNVSMPENSVQHTTLQFMNDINRQSGAEKMETDHLLPDLVDDLKVLSTAELENSMKIFLLDDPISFD